MAMAMAGVVRKYINRFIEVNATSVQNAVDPTEIGCTRPGVLKQLLSKGVLLQVDEKRYYLDEDALELFVSKKRKIGFVILSIALVLLLVVFMAYSS